MKFAPHSTILRATAIALSAAALGAPAASAITNGTVSRYAPNHGFITDTLAPGGSASTGYRFITDTLAPGGGPAQPVVKITSSPSFSWADAGIGAAAAAGVLLALLGGALLAIRRNPRVAIS